MTVEAAWTLPLFFLAMASVICMMELYGLYAEQMVRQQEKAQTAAMAASLLAGQDLPVIDLRETVSYRPRWYPEALPAIQLTARGRARPWTGRATAEGAQEEAGEDEELVYLSERATVYHTSSSCTHLALSVRAVSGGAVEHLRNTDGKRYHACEKCIGSGARNATVYVGENGDCFHNDAECSALNRSVRLVRKSELGSIPCCSRCRAAGGTEEHTDHTSDAEDGPVSEVKAGSAAGEAA